jgi:nucleoside-diphosphate-sugar epimerase
MYNLLSLCTSSQVLTLVYTSTAGVYAGLNKVCTEEDAPVFPDSLYGLSKLTAEFMMQSCCVSYGMNGHVLRVGNVYGPGQRDTRVIQRFTRQIDSGEELAIRGSLQSRRNYLYIDDCVAALRISLDRCSGFDVFNIGGDRDVPLGEIITLLSSYLYRKAEIKPPTLPLRSQNGEDHIRIDTTRSRERLGFTPAVSIEEGLKRFVDWYNEQKQEQRE